MQDRMGQLNNQPPPEPEKDSLKRQMVNWGAQQARDQAKSYALERAAGWAARTGIGSKIFIVTRWLWLAEWGSLAVWVLLAVLGVVGIAQNDTVLGLLVLVLALIGFGLWLLIRKIRRFVERQVEKAFAKFMELVNRGVANVNDWPRWYRQHRRERF